MSSNKKDEKVGAKSGRKGKDKGEEKCDQKDGEKRGKKSEKEKEKEKKEKKDKEMDKEGERDGENQPLGENEMRDLKDRFSSSDKDGDGTINAHEFANLYRSLGREATDAQIQEMLESVDEHGKGTINFQDFLSIVTKKTKKANSMNKLREAFLAFDLDGTGGLRAHELQQVMATLGENLTQDEAKEMIRKADLTGDGCVTFDGIPPLRPPPPPPPPPPPVCYPTFH